MNDIKLVRLVSGRQRRTNQVTEKNANTPKIWPIKSGEPLRDPTGDGSDFSGKRGNMPIARTAAQSIPTAAERQQKVARLRREVVAGRYEVNAAKVAEKMLETVFKDLI